MVGSTDCCTSLWSLRFQPPWTTGASMFDWLRIREVAKLSYRKSLDFKSVVALVSLATWCHSSLGQIWFPESCWQQNTSSTDTIPQVLEWGSSIFKRSRQDSWMAHSTAKSLKRRGMTCSESLRMGIQFWHMCLVITVWLVIKVNDW